MVLSASEHTKFIPSEEVTGSSDTPKKNVTVEVQVQSAGYHDGNFAKIEVNGTATADTDERGLNVVLINSYDGSLFESTSFDTHISKEDAEDFARLIESIEPGVIVIVASKDDCSEQLTEAAKLACESIGSAKIRDLKYRDSWCIIGRKGALPGSVTEMLQRSKAGPTEMMRQQLDFTNVATPMAPLPQSDARILPSKGYWLRRRKIDGALQRTPQGFYPKIHKLLERSVGGIKVNSETLPRDPTISEKTPEEISFALQVESLLNGIHDPAQRQMAVECLSMISEIERRNPEIQIGGGHEVLNLVSILDEACRICWVRWVQKDGERLGVNPQQQSFEHNETLARRLFYDLPQSGKDGSMNFLARAAFKTVPYDVNIQFEPTPVSRRNTASSSTGEPSGENPPDCRQM